MRRRPLAFVLQRTADGAWVVGLTDGREFARFRGFAARFRAERYLDRLMAGYR